MKFLCTLVLAKIYILLRISSVRGEYPAWEKLVFGDKISLCHILMNFAIEKGIVIYFKRLKVISCTVIQKGIHGGKRALK